MGSWTVPDTRGPRARTGETATLPAQPRAWTGPRDVRSTKKAKCFRETPCPGSGGDRAPAGAASPSPGEPACGKGWNLISDNKTTSRNSSIPSVLGGEVGAAPSRPGTTTSSSRPSTLTSHSSDGARGETEAAAWHRARRLEGYVCVSRARPRPCSRGGICRVPGHEGCAGRPAESGSRKGKGWAGLQVGARLQGPAAPRPQVGLIAPCRRAAPRTLRLTQVALIRGPRGGAGSGRGLGGGMMEAEPAPDLSMLLLRELLAPSCLDPEPLPGPPAQQAPRTPRCLRTSSSSFWPARQDSVTSLHLLRETAAGLAEPPAQDTPARGPCWERKALGVLDPPPLAGDPRAMLTPTGQRGRGLGPPEISAAPPAPPRRRPRKQSNPRQGAEKVDPRFAGVTLRFQIKPDSSLEIIRSYSLASSSRSQAPPTGPEANPGGSEALDMATPGTGPEPRGAFTGILPDFPTPREPPEPGRLTSDSCPLASAFPEPRRCASCRTQRTPLWRDAEDGTPLCNACGIRYKKYGTRCASCWLVPRKNVQPKKLCGRCGMFLGPDQGPPQEG